MKNIVIFSGAGVSAESGLQTFRDSNGLWENYNVIDVATPEAWANNPKMVMEFYNLRRKQVMEAIPNEAHYAIADLESKFKVEVVTQNIDDLHEKAGSKNVIHLHGEITKSRSTANENLLYPMDTWELKLGDKCELGSQLRPHVVWFGEPVPMMDKAYEIAKQADILIVVGTSLNVYPAAGIVHLAPEESEKYIIDPKDVKVTDIKNMTIIKEKASTGLTMLARKLLKS